VPDILVVDDDVQVCELLQMYLAEEHFQVRVVHDGHAAIAAVNEAAPDLIVLDIMLPGLDGYEVCRRIRATSEAPVLFLTARDDEADPIIGLEVGADDYVTKPFNPREVVARVKAILRRGKRTAEAAQKIEIGNLALDLSSRETRVGGELVKLTQKEFDIVWLLALHPRIVHPREKILQQIWGYNEDYTDYRTIDTHVKHLRKKLNDAGLSGCKVDTVWGIGYRIAPEED
jgi:two-component system response regulator ResD